MKEYLEMKEYFQESVLSTISTSRSKMENARYIPLGILLYIRERCYRLQYLILGVLERRGGGRSTQE
jgi:hypothetical protein